MIYYTFTLEHQSDACNGEVFTSISLISMRVILQCINIQRLLLMGGYVQWRSIVMTVSPVHLGIVANSKMANVAVIRLAMLENAQPCRRSESRRLSGRPRPMRAVAHKHDHCPSTRSHELLQDYFFQRYRRQLPAPTRTRKYSCRSAPRMSRLQPSRLVPK